jgi:hypothetical protein
MSPLGGLTFLFCCLKKNIMAEFQPKVLKHKLFFSKCLWISKFCQIFNFNDLLSNPTLHQRDPHNGLTSGNLGSLKKPCKPSLSEHLIFLESIITPWFIM